MNNIINKKGTHAMTLIMNKVCPKSKRSQMELSFGMIFSIILIVIFIGFAIYAISIFLETQKDVQAEIFFTSLQTDIDKMWTGSGQQTQNYSVPGKAEYICFANFNAPLNNKEEIYTELKRFSDEGNLFFYPREFNGKNIEHIDIDKTTNEKNPLCIKNNNGVKITIKKGDEESLVTISG